MLPDIAVALPTLEFKPLEGFEVTLKTITPMFGGGPVAKTVDQAQPIHASGVRGHLRFWWRATKGATYTNPKALQDAEKALWGSATKGATFATPDELYKAEENLGGSTTTHGKVVTRVQMKAKGIEFIPNSKDSTGYALFPFIENKDKGQHNVQFTVKVVAPNMYHAELLQAMAAWVQFGGVGSRTRRGCGSLEWVDGEALPQLMPVEKRPAMDKLTALPQVMYLGDPTDPIGAWKNVLAKYKNFRQSRNGQDFKHPGRSKWPEPDTIRLILEAWSRKHKPEHPEQGFPRADLGLPIIFHFSDPKREGEPADSILELSGGRFASPVITKVVKTPKGYQPMLAVLRVPHVWEFGDVLLEGQVVNANISQDTEPLYGKPVREALVEFYKKAGYQEVKL